MSELRVLDLLDGKDYFYIMHLSYSRGRDVERLWNYAKKHSVIGLDYVQYVPRKWSTISESEKERLGREHPKWMTQFKIFCEQMGKDETVLVLDGMFWLLGVAKTIKDYYRYDENLSETSVLKHGYGEPFFDHIRDVEWEKACDYSKRTKMPEPIWGFSNTLARVLRDSNSRRWSILTELEV